MPSKRSSQQGMALSQRCSESKEEKQPRRWLSTGSWVCISPPAPVQDCLREAELQLGDGPREPARFIGLTCYASAWGRAAPWAVSLQFGLGGGRFCPPRAASQEDWNPSQFLC